MKSNFLTAVPGALAVTALILLTMQALIAMQPMTLDERPRYKLGRFILEPRDEELHKIDEKPKRIDPAEPTPPLRPAQDLNNSERTLRVPSRAATPGQKNPRLTSPLAQDGPLVAMIRVQPTYPSGAAAQGLEGYVTVEFDVLPDGSVANIRVLESSSRAFERSAIQAASRFRYKARVVSGEPQLTSGVRYRFRFEMDK